MPTARSRLADIEGCPLGRPLSEREVIYANVRLKQELEKFLAAVQADKVQCEDFRALLNDGIADATARQMREIEEGEG